MFLRVLQNSSLVFNSRSACLGESAPPSPPLLCERTAWVHDGATGPRRAPEAPRGARLPLGRTRATFPPLPVSHVFCARPASPPGHLVRPSSPLWACPLTRRAAPTPSVPSLPAAPPAAAPPAVRPPPRSRRPPSVPSRSSPSCAPASRPVRPPTPVPRAAVINAPAYAGGTPLPARVLRRAHSRVVTPPSSPSPPSLLAQAVAPPSAAAPRPPRPAPRPAPRPPPRRRPTSRRPTTPPRPPSPPSPAPAPAAEASSAP